MNVPLLFAIFIIIFHNMGNATYTPIIAGTLKSISNLNVKGRRKIILKTYLQAVFFLLSPEMDAGFIFNEEYNCIFE